MHLQNREMSSTFLRFCESRKHPTFAGVLKGKGKEEGNRGKNDERRTIKKEKRKEGKQRKEQEETERTQQTKKRKEGTRREESQ